MSSLPLKASRTSIGGWDAYADNSYGAAVRAGVLNAEHLQAVKPFLWKIKPMPAAFDREYVKKLDGKHIKRGKTK